MMPTGVGVVPKTKTKSALLRVVGDAARRSRCLPSFGVAPSNGRTPAEVLCEVTIHCRQATQATFPLSRTPFLCSFDKKKTKSIGER
jgi:hypothetical protein